MGMTFTLTVLGAGGVLVLLGLWLSRRPYQPGKPPIIPPGALMFVGLVVVFVMAGHLVTLITGTPFVGRRGY